MVNDNYSNVLLLKKHSKWHEGGGWLMKCNTSIKSTLSIWSEIVCRAVTESYWSFYDNVGALATEFEK